MAPALGFAKRVRQSQWGVRRSREGQRPSAKSRPLDKSTPGLAFRAPTEAPGPGSKVID
jgi:hypothetical protein